MFVVMVVCVFEFGFVFAFSFTFAFVFSFEFDGFELAFVFVTMVVFVFVFAFTLVCCVLCVRVCCFVVVVMVVFMCALYLHVHFSAQFLSCILVLFDVSKQVYTHTGLPTRAHSFADFDTKSRQKQKQHNSNSHSTNGSDGGQERSYMCSGFGTRSVTLLFPHVYILLRRHATHLVQAENKCERGNSASTAKIPHCGACNGSVCMRVCVCACVCAYVRVCMMRRGCVFRV